MLHNILQIIYLLASVSFIIGLKKLSSPKTAREGNFLAAGGMCLAIFATIFLFQSHNGGYLGNKLWIFSGIAIGTFLGTFSAKKVKMTAMPQMVSLFNGMGGACAAAISLVEFTHLNIDSPPGMIFVVVAGLVIGSVSFSGSIIAYAKLQEIMKTTNKLPGHNILTAGLLLGIAFLTIMLTFSHLDPALFYILFALSLGYGILFVIPIGGADMPVVI